MIVRCLLALVLVSSIASSATGQTVINTNGLTTGDQRVLLEDGWRFHLGDDPTWALPGYDDSAWKPGAPVFQKTGYPEGWQGIGWFRCVIHVDSSLLHKPLAILTFVEAAAVEVYLDGRLVRRLGIVGATPGEELLQHMHEFPVLDYVTLEEGRSHVVALRLSHHANTHFDLGRHELGARIAIGEPTGVTEHVRDSLLRDTSYRTFFATVPLAIALLHFLIFIFYRKVTAHLFFSLFSFSAAAIVYIPLRFNSVQSTDAFGWSIRTFEWAIILTCVVGLRFLHAILYDRLPKHYWIWPPAGLLMTVVSWNGPVALVLYFCLATFVETFRILILAVVRRRPYAWLIALGMATFTALTAIQIVNVLASDRDDQYLYLYGLLAMMICMSIYMALHHTRVNRSLEHQLEEVKKLSARTIEQERRAKEQEVERLRLESENELKAKELEAAKKRQAVLDELAQTNEELRQTQSQLVQSEKMAALGNLVAGVAHEINTPVGAIRSMHDTMVKAVTKLRGLLGAIPLDDYPEGKKVDGVLKVIEEANTVIDSGSGRVARIVKRLRSFARLDEADLKTVDIHEGIEDTLTLVHHELKHNITVHKNYGKIPEVACYPGQLNQVFLNILMNARQAISGDGTITIATSQSDDMVRIDITDTGKGIPKEHLEKVFDPGFTTKGVGVGTGLGLSICYQIIQAHKGRITVSSEVGRGTTFSISVPVTLGAS